MSETDRQLLDRFEAIIREAVAAIAASNATSMQIAERLRGFEGRLEKAEQTMLIAARALENLARAEAHRAEIEEETLSEIRETKEERRKDLRAIASHPIFLLVIGALATWVLQLLGAPTPNGLLGR